MEGVEEEPRRCGTIGALQRQRKGIDIGVGKPNMGLVRVPQRGSRFHREVRPMQRAYVLIETVGGKSKEVVDALRRISGIAVADVVTGPYDVIAVAQGNDANSIGRLVLNEVRGIPGISKTMTCLAVES